MQRFRVSLEDYPRNYPVLFCYVSATGSRNYSRMEITSNKEKDADRPSSVTVANLPFSYFHLSLVHYIHNHTDAAPLDLVTVRTYLTSALQQFLGLTGTAILIDVLKVEGNDVWIRLPNKDSRAVQGALSQWTSKEGSVSWRINGSGRALGSLLITHHQALFGA